MLDEVVDEVKHFWKKIIALGLIEILISDDSVNICVTLNIPAFSKGCYQLTRLEVKESQAVTTTVKIDFERKIQSVKEFNQIGNEINQSINQYIFQIYIYFKLYISDS